MVQGTEAHFTQPPDVPHSERHSAAHWGVFPVVNGAQLPSPGPFDAAPLSIFLQAWRQRQVVEPHPVVGSDVLLQLNHPRGIQFSHLNIRRHHGLFEYIGFVPGKAVEAYGLSWLEPVFGMHPFDFDLIEVMNRASPKLWSEVRQDWFGLMNHGRFPTGTGNTDTHTTQAEQPGFPVNLVQVAPPQAGEALDLSGFVDALRAGRTSVSNGSIVSMSVSSTGNQAGPGGELPAIGGTVCVTATVQAAAWVPVPEVRLILDGEVVVTEKLAPLPSSREVHRGTFTWDLHLDEDSWVLVEAGWPVEDRKTLRGGLYSQVAPGHIPVGFTNPVRISID